MSDASKICLVDSTTITWDIDLSAVEANALVSGASDNLIQISSAGMLAPYRKRWVQRYATGSTSVQPTGAQAAVASGFTLGRFCADTPNSPGGVLLVSGLYHVTCCCSWAASAAGTFRALMVNPLANGVQYPAVEYTAGVASSFNANHVLVQFDGILPLVGGSGITFLVQHDVGANLNALGGNEAIGIEAMCNLLMET
jgi:hypothetical protein